MQDQVPNMLTCSPALYRTHGRYHLMDVMFARHSKPFQAWTSVLELALQTPCGVCKHPVPAQYPAPMVTIVGGAFKNRQSRKTKGKVRVHRFGYIRTGAGFSTRNFTQMFGFSLNAGSVTKQHVGSWLLFQNSRSKHVYMK